MADEYTAKFKVDISDLKKNITEASKQIKLATAEFKTASSGMDNWSKSTDGVSAKLKSLDTILKSQKTILTSYKDQLTKQQEAYQENGKRADALKAKLQELAANGVSKSSDEYKKYQSALKSVLKEQQNNESAIEELNLKIIEQQGTVNKTEKDIRNYTSTLDKLEAEQKAAAEAANKQKTAYDSLKDTISGQESRLDALKREYANVVVEQGKNSDTAKKLANEIKKLSGELNENKEKLREADKSADDFDETMKEVKDSSEKASGGFTIMKGALANLVADGIRMAISALRDFVGETIRAGQDFDSSMSQVAAVSGATGKDLEALRDKAKEMGATTKFSASESADAFNYMAMAGWKTEDMLSGIEGVLNLAAAANTDLATTSDIVTDALTAFGEGADQAGRLADIMAAASSNANTNVEMMGATFKYVAPIAGAMGYSMEDTAVAIGLMANAGIKGEQAGTSLRSMLTRLASPPKEAADAMDALGISITNADGTMKPMNEVLGILREKFDGLSESQQAQYAKALAGQEAMSGLLAIVNASPADFDKLTDAVNNSNGAAEKMAETMQDNLGGDMTKLKSELEGVQIAIYEKFEPALRKGVDILSKLLDAIMWVVDHSTGFIAAIAAMAAGLAAYFAYMTAINVMKNGWMALSIVQKAVAAGQAVLNAVMAANPIGIVIALVAALVAAFIVLWKKSEKFRKFWIDLWKKIVNVVKPVVKAIVKWFTETWDSIKKVWDKVKPYFDAIWNGIKAVFSVVKAVLSAYFKAAWEAIKTIWSVVVPYFKEVWNTIKNVFSVVKTVLSGYFKAAWEAIKTIWDVVTGYFRAIWETIKGIFSVVKAVLSGNWRDAWNAIKGIVDTWKGYFSKVWEDIKGVFKSVKDFFKNSFESAWTAIKNVFSGWGSFFSGLWNTISTTFSSLGTKIGNAISGAVKSGINGVIGMIESTINSAIGLINGAINLINKLPGVNVGKISKLTLPRLARGGVLERGQVGLLEGSGAEAVVPLERNKRWIRAVANDMRKELQGGYNKSISATTKNNVNNFTQNIYAPKQPSRIELYRQTKNLLSLAEGGMV